MACCCDARVSGMPSSAPWLAGAVAGVCVHAAWHGWWGMYMIKGQGMGKAGCETWVPVQ
jgi:hypothetical protein